MRTVAGKHQCRGLTAQAGAGTVEGFAPAGAVPPRSEPVEQARAEYGGGTHRQHEDGEGEDGQYEWVGLAVLGTGHRTTLLQTRLRVNLPDSAYFEVPRHPEVGVVADRAVDLVLPWLELDGGVGSLAAADGLAAAELFVAAADVDVVWERALVAQLEADRHLAGSAGRRPHRHPARLER